MFSSHTAIEKLNAEALINISSFLDVASLLQFSLSAKAFRHLIRDELVFRRLVERDYRVTDKQAEQTWVDIYKEHKLKKSNGTEPTATTAAAVVTEPTEVQEVEAEDIIDTTVQEATDAAVVEKEETIVTQTIVEEQTTTTTATATEEATVTEQVVAEKTETPSEQQQEQQQQPVVEAVEKIEQVPSTTTSSTDCPHLEKVSDSINEIKRILYNNKSESLCDLCLSKTSSYLNMSDSCHNEACRSCLETEADDEEHFPVQLELSTCKLYCFKCKDENGSSPRLLDGDEKAQKIIAYIKTPASDDDLDKRRKAEQQLYVQELRREDMSLKHYLVEKQWGRSWMLFRTREGSPSPGKITNQKLARLNGTLDPNIRLPMDKYRPSPETHADIVSERLWSYLVRAYGVQGRAYSEDDIIAPEYARLRVYVDDYKKSIHLYP